jgi:hypothetical protein
MLLSALITNVQEMLCCPASIRYVVVFPAFVRVKEPLVINLHGAPFSEEQITISDRPDCAVCSALTTLATGGRAAAKIIVQPVVATIQLAA